MDGRRVAVKYFNKAAWPTLASELEFEKTIFLKTQRSNPRGEPDIQLLDSSLMVFKFVADLQFYAVAGTGMNEMVLASVLTGFYECTPAPLPARRRRAGAAGPGRAAAGPLLTARAPAATLPATARPARSGEPAAAQRG